MNIQSLFGPDESAPNFDLTPDRSIPLDSPYFQAVRIRVAKKGFQIFRRRWAGGIYKPLGIATWSQALSTEERIPPNTSEKRVNELASKAYYDTPLFLHHANPTLDGDLLTKSFRLMSSYDLNPEHPSMGPWRDEIGLSLREGNERL